MKKVNNKIQLIIQESLKIKKTYILSILLIYNVNLARDEIVSIKKISLIPQ